MRSTPHFFSNYPLVNIHVIDYNHSVNTPLLTAHTTEGLIDMNNLNTALLIATAFFGLIDLLIVAGVIAWTLIEIGAL